MRAKISQLIFGATNLRDKVGMSSLDLPRGLRFDSLSERLSTLIERKK